MVFVTNEGLFGPFCTKKRRRKSWNEPWGDSGVNDPWSESGINDPWGSDSWGSDSWGSDSWGSDNWGSDWNNDFYGDNEIDAIFTSNSAAGMKFSFDFNFEFDMVPEITSFSSTQATTTSKPAIQILPTKPPVVTMSSTTKQTTTQTTTQKSTTRRTTRKTTPAAPRNRSKNFDELSDQKMCLGISQNSHFDLYQG